MHEPQISSANFDYRSLGTGKLNLRAVKCAPPAKVAPPILQGSLKKGKWNASYCNTDNRHHVFFLLRRLYLSLGI